MDTSDEAIPEPTDVTESESEHLETTAETTSQKTQSPLKRKDRRKEYDKETSKRNKYLLPSQHGYLDTDPSVSSFEIDQLDIVKSVDITNASKHFELDLNQLGPYRCNYFRNGRLLLLGGRRGHVAAFNWLTKKLICEFNVQESVHDIQWLHVPNMFAVAQKEWVHIYDDKSIELNVMKNMYRVQHLEFLPYHLLLTSSSDNGFLNWLDISMGKTVATFNIRTKVTFMTHNPSNALLFCSHPNGTITMWTPNHNRPAVSMLCHGSAARGVSVSSDGRYYATTGLDRKIKIWDLRNNYTCLKTHTVNHVPDSCSFSQRDMLAVAIGNQFQVFKDCTRKDVTVKPYLRHKVGHVISDVQFCPFEDVLGISHASGFTSALIPGSGEPNFDSHEANPFMTKSQQREMEVKLLLDKIPSEMICLDSRKLAHVSKEEEIYESKKPATKK